MPNANQTRIVPYWRKIVAFTVWQFRNEGPREAVRAIWGAFRALRRYAQHERLFNIRPFERYLTVGNRADLLFHLTHRHFLCNDLSLSERVECALQHFTCEDLRYSDTYHAAVYAGTGIQLWCATVGGVRYSIRLCSSVSLRHEGPVSVVLLADEAPLHETSFAWVEGRILGGENPTGTELFVTRNQSVPPDSAALAQFRSDFRQNSPSYFCLAAIHGIALSHQVSRIVGIRHDLQIAFDPKFTSGFKNSYCDFWLQFGGVALGRRGSAMPVPTDVAPIASLKAKHRARARSRRMFWAQICNETVGVLSRYRTKQGAARAIETVLVEDFVS